MERVNIFTRMLKSVSDFKFSNTLIKEKTGKSIGLMFFGYLLLAIIMVSFALITINPALDEVKSVLSSEFDKIPNFTYDHTGFSFEDGRTYFEYESEYFSFYYDDENRNPVSYYTGAGDFLLIKDGMLYMSSSTPTPLTSTEMQPGSVLNKEVILQTLQVVQPVVTVFVIIMALFGIIVAFIVSLIVWVEMIIINGFTKKDVKSGDLYKVAVHSMVLPGVVFAINFVTPIKIPFMGIVYLAIAGFYGYKFLAAYNDEPEMVTESASIYEDE